MKNCSTDKIRNFCLAGHAGTGKTSLADLMLFKAGVVSRLGSVEQGTSVSDFRPEEQERKSSVYAAVLHCPWKDHHFFFTDTPGYADFCGEPTAALTVADAAIIVVDPVSGIGPGTIRAWKMATALGIPRFFFVNALDRDEADFEASLKMLRDSYGATTCVPFTVPVGRRAALSKVVGVLAGGEVPPEVQELAGKCREALMDTVAESDEELMARYLEGEALTEAEISRGLHAAIMSGAVVPVFAGSVSKDIGVAELMDAITVLFPNPLAGRAQALTEGELARADVDADAVGRVFKSVADPFIGQLTFLRIFSGQFRSDSEAINVTTGQRERWGALAIVNGKEQTPVEAAGPGEIVALAKLKDTHLADTLASKAGIKPFPPIEFPSPTISYAVTAAKTGEEEKISFGLQRLSEEDATIKMERNQETGQLLLAGMGDLHLTTVMTRLKSTFKVEVVLGTPKVPYRETVTGTGSASYRHKKQTGGRGQFAEVHLRIEPLATQDFEFSNEVVGGNIPKNFIPAVEKGVVEALERGPLAGCRVINFKAIVYDGKYHPVDSSEIAFKIASRGAFRAAIKNSRPILLEPIMRLKIVFPDQYMGDISGDLNSRRGRILGMDREEGLQVVHADVPMAETFTYSSTLRSITQGRGSFEMSYDRYEPVPANVSKQIQEAAAVKAEEEE